MGFGFVAALAAAVVEGGIDPLDQPRKSVARSRFDSPRALLLFLEVMSESERGEEQGLRMERSTARAYRLELLFDDGNETLEVTVGGRGDDAVRLTCHAQLDHPAFHPNDVTNDAPRALPVAALNRAPRQK